MVTEQPYKYSALQPQERTRNAARATAASPRRARKAARPNGRSAPLRPAAAGGGAGGKRRRYLVDGGMLPQRQVPEAAAHLVPALAHCKGERRGSGPRRGRRGGLWAPRPLTLHHHRLGHGRAAARRLLFRTRRPEATPPWRPRRRGVRCGGKALPTAPTPLPRLPPAVGHPTRWFRLPAAYPSRVERSIGQAGGGSCAPPAAWGRRPTAASPRQRRWGVGSGGRGCF